MTASLRRTFVLDTSVLLSAPNAIRQFGEHEVVVPMVVLVELEGKRNHPTLGFPAREALRDIDDLWDKTSLTETITLNEDGGTVRFEVNHIDQAALPEVYAEATDNDTRILAVAKNLAAEGFDVTVVSKDLPLRLKASSVGVRAEQYLNELVIVDKPYTGVEHVEVDADVIDALYSDKTIDMVDAVLPDGTEVVTNSGVVLTSSRGSALALVTPDKTLDLVPKVNAFGVEGRSAEQKIALAHLMNPDVGVVSLGGKAGTGKTFLALAAGLDQVLEQQTYQKVMVFRPLFAVGGQELGYLPGTAEEKMSPWGAAVFDALGAMVSKDVVDEIIGRGLLEVLPLTHIRGRTLNDAFVIVDEAQSLERPVLLTALSRLGEGSKIVLSHDVAQRDNLRVGRYDGIAAVVERLKGEALFAHATFTRSERGPVAEMVTRLMDDFGN